MVFPRAMGSSISAFEILVKQLPIVWKQWMRLVGDFNTNGSFAGDGAIILIPKAESERAISSSKFLILKCEFPPGRFHKGPVGPMVVLICAKPICNFQG